MKKEKPLWVSGSHQFYVGQLLGHGEGVVADGQDVPVDAGFGLEDGEALSHRGVDLDQSLLVLAEDRQPPDQTLAQLARRLPVNLPNGRRGGKTHPVSQAVAPHLGPIYRSRGWTDGRTGPLVFPGSGGSKRLCWPRLWPRLDNHPSGDTLNLVT